MTALSSLSTVPTRTRLSPLLRPKLPKSLKSTTTSLRPATQVTMSHSFMYRVCVTTSSALGRFVAAVLLQHPLNFKPLALIPRGLVNTQNWCYVNAVSFTNNKFNSTASQKFFFCAPIDCRRINLIPIATECVFDCLFPELCWLDPASITRMSATLPPPQVSAAPGQEEEGADILSLHRCIVRITRRRAVFVYFSVIVFFFFRINFVNEFNSWHDRDSQDLSKGW